ncbi:MAG: hypothetical protein Q9224_000750 [Gallowayella concinna]
MPADQLAQLLSYGPIICVLVCQYPPPHSARQAQITNEFGKHIWALEKGNAVQFMRILYIYEVFYYASCSAIKICM